MAPTIEDRYLWLGLGVFTFIAVKAVSAGLRHIVTLTEVHNPTTPPPLPPPPATSSRDPSFSSSSSPPPTQPQNKEDTIKTASLSVLATCTNIEIRRAATKILCDRFMSNPSAGRLLLKDLASDDAETVHRARLALNLLEDYEALSGSGSRSRQQREEMWGLGGVMGISGRGDGGAGGVGGNAREGVAGRDPEERDLRRRRREAMVLNEGDRPVSQEDVWMRDGEGRMAIEESWDDRM
ncbi:hypothetical protein DM02DRAFT_608129 [Periconia macrospinosa]|uniref:Uncharacterized protein n=1 Tax=Periconia macrospinosa TaxID=97972 RepID=A0A2V1EEZ9_9PLEO|nr:hypothetical protein DM02DRAFT_608129 [Periconia macrospinosa]